MAGPWWTGRLLVSCWRVRKTAKQHRHKRQGPTCTRLERTRASTYPLACAGYKGGEDPPSPPATRELTEFQGSGLSDQEAFEAMLAWACEQPVGDGELLLLLLLGGCGGSDRAMPLLPTTRPIRIAAAGSGFAARTTLLPPPPPLLLLFEASPLPHPHTRQSTSC